MHAHTAAGPSALRVHIDPNSNVRNNHLLTQPLEARERLLCKFEKSLWGDFWVSLKDSQLSEASSWQ